MHSTSGKNAIYSSRGLKRLGEIIGSLAADNLSEPWDDLLNGYYPGRLKLGAAARRLTGSPIERQMFVSNELDIFEPGLFSQSGDLFK